MIYIYNCYGGTHSSSVAAAIHLGKIRTDRIPSKEDILGIDYFNTLTYQDRGKIVFHGKDSEGDSVYTVGRGTCKYLVPSLVDLVSVIQLQREHKEQVIFSNTSPTVPLAMTFGGFFSRACKIDVIGVPLLVKGVKQSFSVVKQLVEHTKHMGKTTCNEITILENKSYSS